MTRKGLGLVDRRVGKISPHRIGADEVERIVALYCARYAGWTIKHFWERARDKHNLLASLWLDQEARSTLPACAAPPKRSAHRKKRPAGVAGMLLHQDGSRINGFRASIAARSDRNLDDATSELYSAFLVEEEGTASTFRALDDVIARKGLFCALYTDRGGHYFSPQGRRQGCA